MKVNTAKFKEIILYAKGAPPLISPPPLSSAIPRFIELNILGVTIEATLSMTSHVTNLITRSHQSLYALRVIKAHGLQGARLHSVTRALLQSRLSYAISAWVGFANRGNMFKLQKFIEMAA